MVMLVLSYSVFESTYYLSSAFVSGIRSGMEDAKTGRVDMAKSDNIQNLQVIGLFPDDFANMKDSVYNEKRGEYVPAIYYQLHVSVETNAPLWVKIVSHLSAFLYLLANTLAIIIFVKFIISINKSEIFLWENVRRLRKLGLLLVLSFLFTLILALIPAYQLSGVFSVSGYSLSASSLISTLTLVLGLMSLIVGEVFAIGLRMQEEQELTI